MVIFYLQICDSIIDNRKWFNYRYQKWFKYSSCLWISENL